MKPLYLKLRGSIGIKKGLGLEEIEIDFEQFNPGLIALTGRNGSGKTTIMENLHPYRQMVSRDGSLQSHFYLKDSYRILSFEFDGNIYQSKILIDALTGNSEAYLYKNGKALNDGKVTTYDALIEDLLGTPDLFFNSVFSAQKSKGISELKPADRRKLFYELLNLNTYEIYLEQVKDKLKELLYDYSKLEGEISALDNGANLYELENERQCNLEYQAELINEISNNESEIENLNKQIRETEIKIKLLEERVKISEEAKEETQSLENQISDLTLERNNKINKLQSEIDEAKKKLERYKKLTTLEAKEKTEQSIQRKKELNDKLLELKTKQSELTKQHNQNKTKLQAQLKEINQLTQNLNEIKSEIKIIKVNYTNYKKELEELQQKTKTIKTVPCDEATGSNCKFLIDAYKSKELIPELETKIKEQTELLAIKDDEAVKLQKKINKLDNQYQQQEEIIDNEYSSAIIELDSEIKSIETELKQLNQHNWEKIKDEINDADKNIELLNQTIKNLEAHINFENDSYESTVERLRAAIYNWKGKIDNTAKNDIEALQVEKINLNQKILSFTQLLNASKSKLDIMKNDFVRIEQLIEQCKKNKDKLDELENKKGLLDLEIKDYNFLSKAFDKTGIPVLKLENSGIEITSIANDLLNIFDNKFRIVFETTKLKADKKGYKESFDINIIDDDGVCEIANKSGGQQVWLETAIQLAISLVVRNQGRNIQTAFLDEKDGALDLDNAFNYIEMLRKAHQQSGVHFTFIITHRPELLDYIPQQIKLADSTLTIIN